MKQDKALIPKGEYCYTIVKLKKNEILKTGQYGKNTRESSYHKGYKSVLCPYWKRTDYGTIKCLYTKEEAIDEEQHVDGRTLIQKYFSDEKAIYRFHGSSLLADEIKTCGINTNYPKED